MKTLQEIQARKLEIRELLKGDGADLEVLEKELDQLEVDERAIVEATEQRAALVARVVGVPALAVIRSFPSPGTTEGTEERSLGADSPEYRAAFLKTLAKDHKTGAMRLGELTDVEQRAFTFTTANTPAVLPTAMATALWDLVSVQYAILNHISKNSFKAVFEFMQCTVRVAGTAAITAEGIANAEDVNLTFVKQSLTGQEIKAHVVITRKMQIQSMTGFEDFLVRQLSQQIGEQMNRVVFAAIDANVIAGNVFSTVGLLDAADFRNAFAALRGARGTRRVYANNATVWGHIAAIEDLNGRPLFIESTVNDDPSVQGRIYGTQVVLDETLADDELKIGYTDCIEANLFQDVEILSDIDVKTHDTTYGGYALFDCGLGDTRSWATIDITPAG